MNKTLKANLIIRNKNSRNRGAIIFGLLPYTMLFGATYICYFTLLFFLLKSKHYFFNGSLVLACVLFSIYYSLSGPFSSDYFSPGWLNSLNSSFALSLIFIAPFIKLNFHIRSSAFTLYLILIFFLICFIGYSFGRKAYESYLQVATFNFVLYLAFTTLIREKIIIIFVALLSGGRAILAGVVYGLIFMRRAQFHRNISRITLYIAITLLLSGSLAIYFQQFISMLIERQIYLKGRTGYWMAMLENDLTFLGHGAGASLVSITNKFGTNQLPHNDYLRVFTDYGMMFFGLLLFTLQRISLRSRISFFTTAVMAAYLATGNPLSFASAISAYVLVVNSTDFSRTLARQNQLNI